MSTLRVAVAVLILASAWSLSSLAQARAQSQANNPGKPRVVKIGGVASGPETVVVFRNLCQYLKTKRFAADFVLYSNYDALEQALERDEIDIAWNTPLAHARYHVNKGKSRTLAMRDVDQGFRSVVIARKDSKIEDIEGLEGKTLALGSREAAEATTLPLHYLSKQGLKLDRVKTLKLDEERDFRGNPCGSPQDVLEAVQSGRAQAGIIGENLWRGVSRNEARDGDRLTAIWTSPEFSHCVFTASTEFDASLADAFTDLMVKMTPNDPGCADVLRLEGAKRWVKGSPEGFKDLIEAVQAAPR